MKFYVMEIVVGSDFLTLGDSTIVLLQIAGKIVASIVPDGDGV